MAQMNLPTEKKQVHRYTEETCGCQGEGGGCGMAWVFEVSRCQPLPLEWISNEIMLHITGNSIQPLVMEQEGGWCESRN